MRKEKAICQRNTRFVVIVAAEAKESSVPFRRSNMRRLPPPAATVPSTFEQRSQPERPTTTLGDSDPLNSVPASLASIGPTAPKP